MHAAVAELRRAISTEILIAAGIPRSGWLQPVLRPLVFWPAHRFARFAAELDRRTAQFGVTAAARWAIPVFVQGYRVEGSQHIPQAGPLVVASNHPGSYDALLIAAALARDDLKILASDVPFLRSLVGISPHLLYTDVVAMDPHARMASARDSVRHLQAGGALLVYAGGVVDPDPALMPGAREALDRWSPSLALFLRRAPETRVLPTIVSGVLSPSSLRHPLTRLRKEPQQRQFLAEFLQISGQILLGRRLPLTPTVRFAAPLAASELGAGGDAAAAVAGIVARAATLLDGWSCAGT